MIPPFHAAVDQAVTYLHPTKGLLGCCDFFVSSKFDLPLRQMPWLRRFFWRSPPPTKFRPVPYSTLTRSPTHACGGLCITAGYRGSSGKSLCSCIAVPCLTAN